MVASSGSGNLVNLRTARKGAARDAARKQGDANAARFGRNKVQKLAEDHARARAARHLDQHCRADPDAADAKDGGSGDA